jgi:DNA-binding MarR family transcriptional regulator
VDPATPAGLLHDLFIDLVRVGGMLQPEHAVPGHPISVSQAFALHELDVHGPLSQRDLAERLRLEKSSVSRMAAEMERRGLLVREREPGNRRLYRLRLTDHGRALHANMGSAYHQHYERWVAAMTPEERDALIKGLSAFVRVMHAAPPPWGASDHPVPAARGAGPGLGRHG